MSPLPERYLLLIQKYFRDELSEIEQIEFDKALEDADFRSEVDLQAQVFEGLVAARRENLRAVIEEVKTEIEDEKNAINNENAASKSRILTGISVIFIILLIAIGLYYFSVKDKPDYEAIYAEYYTPYDTPESQRGDNEMKNSSLDNVMSLYENENYAEALSLFDSIRPKSDYIQLLEANCYLNLGQWEEAESVMKTLSQSKDIKILQQAEWYLALSYIKSNKSNLSQEIFNNIKSTPNHLYYERVNKLIEDYGL